MANMMKNFDEWNRLKKVINDKEINNWFHEREIWWCSIGVNVGHEEDGKNQQFERPVLVFRKFNKEIFFGIPVSSKLKNNKFYFQYELHDKKASALLSQLRLFSGKRLIRKIGRLPLGEFTKIEDRVVEIIKTDPLRDPRVPKGNL